MSSKVNGNSTYCAAGISKVVKQSGRVTVRYKENAERLGIPFTEYIQKGQSGQRYCSKCLKWKVRRLFPEFEGQSAYYSGICFSCKSGKRAPAKVQSSLWGPALRAAKKLDIDIDVYLAKRAEGFRWCSDHKDWFDAKEILEKGNNPQITRCKDCNRTRQQDWRRKHGAKPIKTGEVVFWENEEE